MTADTLLSPPHPHPEPLPLSHTHHRRTPHLSQCTEAGRPGGWGSGAGHVTEVVEDFSGAEPW
eukprot:1236280-Rhodomonas_salina.1